MTVENTTSQIEYVGNNSTSTPYVIPFAFLSDPTNIFAYVTDSLGVVTDLVLDTDYTVSYLADGSQGDLVTVVAVPITSTITIYRQVPLTQLTEYHENDDFPSASHERALDKLTMQSQQIARTIADAVQVSGAPGALDPLPFVANSVIGFGTDQLITMTPSELLTFLMISATIVSGSQPTAVFLNAAARAAATPGFSGQIGLQADTGQLYRGTSLVAGGWAVYSAATKVFADATARGLSVPDIIGQLGVQLSDNTTWRASGTSAGNWTATTASSSLADGAVTFAKLSTSAKVFITGVKGLIINRTGGNTVDITLDEVVLTDGIGGLLKFVSPSTITVDITASGVNGLDTGSEAANTWYHIYLISDGTNLKGIFSTSATAPSQTNTPGYTYFEYIGGIRNNASSAFNQQYSVGKRTDVSHLVAAASISYTSLTSVSIASFVPPNAVRVRGYLWTADTANNVGFLVSSSTPFQYYSVGRSSNAVANSPNLPFTWIGDFEVPIKSQSISLLTTSQTYNLEITGWDIK